MDSDSEEERSPAEIKVFVSNCDGLLESTLIKHLAGSGYDVSTLGVPRELPPVRVGEDLKTEVLGSEYCIASMMESPDTVSRILDILNSNPLHRPINLILYSPLLTWGGRPQPEIKGKLITSEEETEEEEEEAQAEAEDDNEPLPPLTDEDYLIREPHPLVAEQYRLEARALQLNAELDRLKVYVFAANLVYGFGEKTLFPFFKSMWEAKIDAFPASLNHVSCIHVKNLAIAAQQIIESPPEENNYFILGEEVCPTLKEIAEAFSRVLADGKVVHIEGEMDELDRAILTTELEAESSFLADAELHCAEGIVASAAQVVDEFRSQYRLDPLKVLVIGPPASRYDEVAQLISQELGLPFIDPKEALEEVLKEESEFAEEILQTIEEEGVTPESVAKATHRRMIKRDCRNYGWVISGFADSVGTINTLFDIGEEEQPSPHWEHIPTHVVIIEADDAELEAHAAEVSDNYQDFKKQLKKYKRGFSGEETVYGFFDDRAIPSLIITAFVDNRAKVLEFLGQKRDFGKPVEEIERERREAEKSAVEKKRREAEERTKRYDGQEKQWEDGKVAFQEQLIQLLEKDEAYLVEKALPLEYYLKKNVLDVVAEGLVQVLKQKPEDPIDYLAAFLFKRRKR